MKTNTLPLSPNLDHLKRQARELYKSIQANDTAAYERIHRQIPNPTVRQKSRFMLCDALLVIAREYGFTSWMALKSQIESSADEDAEIIDKKALAVYEKMLQTIRHANSLYIEIDSLEVYKKEKVSYNTKIRLKKPGFMHIAATKNKTAYGMVYVRNNIIYGYWPEGRPPFNNDDPEHYKQSKEIYYKADHDVSTSHYSRHGQLFGPMFVLDPSLFFKDDIWRDRIRRCVFDKRTSNEYLVIQIGLVKSVHKKWELWIDPVNNLPIKVMSHVNGLMSWSQTENWQKVHIDMPMDESSFSWTPPQEWDEWKLPEIDSTLIKPGNAAPDFELKTLAGSKLKLSSLRGSKTLLIFGSGIGNTDPIEFAKEYGEEIKKCHAKGIHIIGFNLNDEPAYLRSRLEEASIDIPVISDPSEETWKVLFKAYGAYASPTYYVIDSDGIVAESWIWEKERLQNILKRLAVGECPG